MNPVEHQLSSSPIMAAGHSNVCVKWEGVSKYTFSKTGLAAEHFEAFEVFVPFWSLPSVSFPGNVGVNMVSNKEENNIRKVSSFYK